MTTVKKLGVVLACAIGAISVGPTPALGSNLYGWTWIPDSNGRVDFVSINDQTGQASFLFSGTVPGGMQARDLTYDPTNGRFYGSLFDGSDGLLAEIDPVAQTMTTHTYSGLLRPGFEGMEYLKGTGIVVSGADATGTINALSIVSHSGVIEDSALMFDIIDQDHLGANSLGGELHVLDTNDPTNGFQINRWTDPFGANPTLTGVYSGSIAGDPVDLAVDPVTNTFYSSGFSGLLRYDMNLQQQDSVGSYAYPRAIWGIAAVPAPAASVLLSLGGIVVTRRRR